VITVRAEDPEGAIGEASFDVTVVNVNDAPSFVGGGNVSVDEDQATSLPGWATALGAGPFEDLQQLTFEVIGNSNPDLFAAAPTVDPTGALAFVPAANAFGQAQITLRLRDDGGTANGGQDTSPPYDFTIEVLSVNDVPTIAGAALLELVEDTSEVYTFTVDDVEDDPADLQVTVASSDTQMLPLASLVLGGSGADRTLTVTPVADLWGTAFLELTVTDTDGGSSVFVLEVHVEAVDELVDLITTLDNGLDYVDVGSDVTWIATVSNAGPDVAYGVEVLDSAPAGMTDQAWACEGFDGALCGQPDGIGPLALTLQLPPASHVQLTITATVTGDAAPLLTYALEALAGPEAQELEPDDNLAIDVTRVGERVFADGFED
jgi:uncharacterized repeat protein (TIGR01451 family)